MKNNKTRGQMFSGEFLLALVTFMAAFIIAMSMWSTTMRETMESENVKVMENTAVDAAENLIRTPGVPANWTVEEVLSVGLANSSRVLSERKVADFVYYMSDSNGSLCSGGSNYECNQYRLGMEGYNFYFNMTYMNGSTVQARNVSAYTGRLPLNETHVVTVTRSVIFNDEISRIYFTVWE